MSIRRLHLGGKIRVDGWEVLNVIDGPHVDHVGDARDLSQFEDDTFIKIYASHIVEHMDYVNDELQNTLNEWFRVLKPSGFAYISVPDLETLSHLFLQKDKLNFQERFHVMRMMFGGHVDEYDYHLVGLDQEFLAFFLRKAGFVNLRRVPRFNAFSDTSDMEFKGTLISLNVVAEKPSDRS